VVGEFRLDGLEPGRYHLTISDDRTETRHEEPVELSADREIVVELPESGRDRRPE
jgi:hypothetical protein